jgi:hypothetical protein
VSAVLATTSFDFNYSSMSRVLPRLWPNPWAKRMLAHDLPFPTSRLAHDERSIENAAPSIDASALVGLPPDWPGKPFRQARG